MDHAQFEEKIKVLKLKYELTDFGFDTECIYDLGDLSDVLRLAINNTVPEKNIEISEEMSPDATRYVATLSNQDGSMQIFADTNSDWLPEDFFEILVTIPAFFKTDKKYYCINPLSGLVGQEMWFFCGTEENLKKAREEGLPVLLPGEIPEETDAFKNMS